ncbi:MAG: GNAT family N-acetyltransferase [Mycobacterium sp.]
MSERAELRVRLATEDDLVRVCEIVNYFIEKTAFNFRTEPQTVDEWRYDWKRLHSRFPWLVANSDDRLVGVAYAAPWKDRIAYQWTVETTVYVDASEGRRGAGDALYIELLGRLRRQGFRSAVAVIALPNDPSVRLHERHGFVQVGQLVDVGFKRGGRHDVGFWQCTLRSGRDEITPPRPVEEKTSETADAQARTGQWLRDELAPDVAAEAMAAAGAYLQRVDSGPVWRPIDPRDRDWLVNQPLPQEARSLPDLIADINAHVLPYPMGNGHRRFFGWINSPPSAAGIAVEPLAAALNPSCAGGEHAGALLERTVLRWLAELVGYPTGPCAGILTSGASMASIIALAAARNRAARRCGANMREDGLWDQPPMVIYASSEAHTCITKAVELIGMGRRSLRRIPVNDAFAMDTAALASAIVDDTDAGLLPCGVVATAGTVNTGAIDDLATIARLANEHDLWMHVDGAYGALAAANPALRARFAGMERADSIAIDAHKWLGVPIDSGALLAQDADALRETFSLVPDYLRDDTTDDVGWWSEYGIEQTRPFRALRTWATIAHLGKRGTIDLMRRTSETAASFAALLRQAPEFELLAPTTLSVVAFRFTGTAENDIDRINHDIPALLQRRGNVFLTGTTLRGRPALRVCLLNPLVTEDDLRILIEEIRTVGAHLSEQQ